MSEHGRVVIAMSDLDEHISRQKTQIKNEDF